MISQHALEAVLRARGQWNEDGIGRAARARHCHRCHRVVMAGLDAQTCATAVRCDPTPLNATGELSAVLGGRRTFSLTWLGGHYEIDYRDRWRMRTPPGAEPNLDVIAEHSCTTETPTSERAESLIIIPDYRTDIPNDPNY